MEGTGEVWQTNGLRGAKGDMFEGGIHVPCALNMPGVFEAVDVTTILL